MDSLRCVRVLALNVLGRGSLFTRQLLSVYLAYLGVGLRAALRGLEHSLDLQGLVEDLGKVVQNGGLADDQGRPGSLGSRLQFRCSFVAESHNRQVFGSGVLLEPRECSADVVPGGCQVRQHEHRSGLLSAFHQPASVRNRLDTIIHILQPIDELATRQ